MPRLPRLRGREVIAGLRRGGFLVLRTKGSHYFLRHPDGRDGGPNAFRRDNWPWIVVQNPQGRRG